MASPRIFTARQRKRGFTLTEMMVVIGMLTILAAATPFVDFNSYRSESFRGEARILVTALQTARADALNNINQTRHGVAIHPGGYDGYVIFQGDSYAARNSSFDQEVKASYAVTLGAGSPSEVVFRQLSGDALTAAGANYDGNITLIDLKRGGMTQIISLNHEGQISW